MSDSDTKQILELEGENDDDRAKDMRLILTTINGWAGKCSEE